MLSVGDEGFKRRNSDGWFYMAKWTARKKQQLEANLAQTGPFNMQVGCHVLARYKGTEEQCFCPAVVDQILDDQLVVTRCQNTWKINLRSASIEALPITDAEYQEFDEDIKRLDAAIIGERVQAFRYSEKRFQKAYVGSQVGMREFLVWFSDGKSQKTCRGLIVKREKVEEFELDDDESHVEQRLVSETRDGAQNLLIKGDSVLVPLSHKPETFKISRIFAIVNSKHLLLHLGTKLECLVDASECLYVSKMTQDLVLSIVQSDCEHLTVPGGRFLSS